MIIDECDDALPEAEWLQQRLREPQAAPALLFCSYRSEAVIFGLGQRPSTTRREALDRAGVSWLRRRAGGGTVFAGPWLLGVSLLIPAHHALYTLDPRAAYGWFSQPWLDALCQCGVAAEVPDEQAQRRSREAAASAGADWACYGTLGYGELVLAGTARKLLGVAQVRTRQNLALVSALNLSPADWRRFAELCGEPPAAEFLARVNASVEPQLSEPLARWLPTLRGRLVDGLQALLGAAARR